MAGLEADVSSYNQPLPVSPLKQVGEIAAVHQQKLQIDQAKMDQANQALGYMVRAMGSLGPNASKEDYAKAAQNAVDMGLVPQSQENVFLSNLQSAPDSQTFYKQFMSAAMDASKSMELHTGQNVAESDGATNYYGKRDVLSGAVKPVTEIAIQPPPTQPTVNNNPNSPNYLQPGIVGAAAPRGFRPSGGLPVAAPDPAAMAAPTPTPRPRPAGMPVAPIAPPAPVSGPSGPTVQTGHNFDERFASAFPNSIPTGAAPGVAGAIGAVREQSGKDYAVALQRAGNAQADLQPDLAVLDIVKGKAPGDFGPLTNEFNQLKKLAVTWLPDVNPKLINDSSDYDTVKKYLVQGARSAGNTGTNDQLAAAFEGSPNVTMNTATIESIVKSRVALKKMEAAQALLFEKENLPPSEFSKWKAKNQNVLDPRAFGWDLMSNEAREKLVKRLSPKEYQKLESSVQFAHDAQLIEPPPRK